MIEYYTIRINNDKLFDKDFINYDDALSQYNTLKDPSYKLVKVDTIEDAINALKGGN